MRLLVVGFGNMGSAICKGLNGAPESLFEEILVMDHSEEKRSAAVDMGLKVVADFEPADVILLAVKPQNIEEVMRDLQAVLTPQTMVVSIAAGVSLERLSKGLNCEQVVRVMPNTPVLVGMGASAWVASEGVAVEQKTLLTKMLESFGMAIQVQNDDEIDMVTALSGSGPAYVFYFIESLIKGAKKLGLPGKEAHKLAIQTVLGGAELAKQSVDLEGLIQLRNNVTSKGGTTEKALEVLAQEDFENIVAKAMQASYDKTKEL